MGKYEGKDILPLWVADMDFRSPEEVIRVATEAGEFGNYGYGVCPSLGCGNRTIEDSVRLGIETLAALVAGEVLHQTLVAECSRIPIKPLRKFRFTLPFDRSWSFRADLLKTSHDSGKRQVYHRLRCP